MDDISHFFIKYPKAQLLKYISSLLEAYKVEAQVVKLEKYQSFITHEYALIKIKRCNVHKENMNIFIFQHF